jgi:hypothetical protein
MFAGKKTYIVAALAVLGAIGAYLTGDATAAEAIQLAVTAIIGATLRSGIAAG